MASAPSLEDYFRMVEGKTSGLFALPMAGAAEACGAPKDIVEGLEQSARHMGVLFQIQDDTLDLYAQKGRDLRASDIREGKRSVLVVHALAHSSPADAERLLAILDKDRHATSDEDVDWVLELLAQTDSLTFALEQLDERKNRALAVDALQTRPDLKALVGGMCELFMRPIAPLVDQHRARQATGAVEKDA